MTEFLDGARDGAKGEVNDLTTVNFDAMELGKLLHERNSWATRLDKLEHNKSSITADIWKKLRNEYDQKLKARENELLSVREKMRKKLEEMSKLRESLEREFPGLDKRREELNLRFELGDFNQEFYDYVKNELDFQIEVRQKKVEVLGRNVAFYQRALADDGTSPPTGERAGEGEAADSEAFGKGGGSSGEHARPSWSSAEPARESGALAAPPPDQEDEPSFTSIAEEEVEEDLPAPFVEDEPEDEAPPPVAHERALDDGLEATHGVEDQEEPGADESFSSLLLATSEDAVEDAIEEVIEEIEEESVEGDGPVTFVDVPAEEADDFDDDEVEAAVTQIEMPTDGATEETDEVEELEEEIEEDLDVEGPSGTATGEGYLDSISDGLPEEPEDANLDLDDDLDVPQGDDALASESGYTLPDLSGGRSKGTGLDPAREIILDDEMEMGHPGPTPHLVSRSASPDVKAGLAAMSEISNVFARGAETDPEREEAKKILEEVNLEELERAVEGIEGDAEDEELRGFVRDVSGRRGEGVSPPPAVMEVVEGINLGKVFPLSRTSNVTSIGKAPDNTIALPEDKALSRYHAKVIFRQNRFVIMDLDSTNGTGVNGEAITEADLSDEDEIIMGGSRYIFRITSRA